MNMIESWMHAPVPDEFNIEEAISVSEDNRFALEFAIVTETEMNSDDTVDLLYLWGKLSVLIGSRISYLQIKSLQKFFRSNNIEEISYSGDHGSIKVGETTVFHCPETDPDHDKYNGQSAFIIGLAGIDDDVSLSTKGLTFRIRFADDHFRTAAADQLAEDFEYVSAEETDDPETAEDSEAADV